MKGRFSSRHLSTLIGSTPQAFSACHRVKAFFSWVPISRQIPSCDGCGSSNLNDLKPRVPPKFWIWRVPWARLYDLSQKLSLNGRTSLERPARYTRAYSRLRMAIHMIVVLSPWSLRRDALETDLRPRIVAEQNKAGSYEHYPSRPSKKDRTALGRQICAASSIDGTSGPSSRTTPYDAHKSQNKGSPD